jgi:hypothetical protein
VRLDSSSEMLGTPNFEDILLSTTRHEHEPAARTRTHARLFARNASQPTCRSQTDAKRLAQFDGSGAKHDDLERIVASQFGDLSKFVLPQRVRARSQMQA